MESFPPYRISTITATASLNTEVNLDVLYQQLNAMCGDDPEQQTEGIVYLEYGRKKIETIFKGNARKNSIKHRTKESTTKRFDNQVTIVYKFIQDNTTNMVNSKIFKNGNIQMTGVRFIEQGEVKVNKIVEMIKTIYNSGATDVVNDFQKLSCVNYRIRLINSDFRVGFDIRRDQLHRILVEDYKCSCSFEPCIYPGVKLQYYYNIDNPIGDGVCKCTEKCQVGKGAGCGDTDCKKITIAIFQSGCIIITGGQNLTQVSEAYDFICKVLIDNYNDIYKKKLEIPSAINKDAKKIIIKAANIKYLDD
jgi:TATA-box binding protein (TBP) (component of TFIID and TFIIIB)